MEDILEAPVQQPPNKLQMLYNSLRSNETIKGLPDNFDKFKTAMDDPNKAKAFHDALLGNETVKGLPTDFNQFSMVLGLKKAGGAGSPLSTPVAPNTSPPLKFGTQTAPDFKVNPITLPKDQTIQDKLTSKENENIEQDRLDKQTRSLLSGPNYLKNLSKQVGDVQKEHLSELNDPGSKYYKDLADEEEKNSYKGNITLGDRGEALNNTIYKGMGSYGKGVLRAAGAIMKFATKDEAHADIDKATQDWMDVVDKGVDAAQDKMDPAKEAEINKVGLNGMFNSLANYAPAIADAERTGGMSFFFNDYEKGYEDIDKQSKDTGIDLTEGQKQAYATVRGAASALLMTHNLHTLLGNASEGAANKLLNHITTDAIDDLSKKGEDFTPANLNKAVTGKFDVLEDKIKNFGVKSLKGVAASTGDMAAFEAANIGTEHLINTATGKKVFDPSNDAERMQGAIKNGLALGVVGALMHAPMMLAKGTPERETVIGSLYKDPSQNNVEDIKNTVQSHLQNSGMEQENIDDVKNTVDQIHQVIKTLPKGLPIEKQTQITNLILDRKGLEKQMQDAQTENAAKDPVFGEQHETQAQNYQDAIDGINDKIKSIASGKPVKYFRDEEGQPMKQFGDNEPEKISENRYYNEKPNSLFRNEQTQPNTEIPAEQPADETGNPEKTANPTDETIENNQIITNQQENEKDGNEKDGNEKDGEGEKATDAENGGQKEAQLPAEKEVNQTTGDVENASPVNEKGEPNNAVQEQSAGKVDVQPKAENGEGVGSGNAEPKEPAKQGEKEIKPPKEKVKSSLSDDELKRKLELRKKFSGQFNDVTRIPTLLANKEFREYAGLVFKEAAGDFKAFSKELVDNVGEKIKAHLPGLFKELGGKEDEKKPQSITSARNEDTDKIREKLGLSPLMKIAARENPEVWDEVNKTLDENPNATDELISKLDSKMRPVTDMEQGLLVHRQIELETNVQKANDLVIENKENGVKDPWDQINLQNTRKALSDILELQRKVGREWGLSGKFRQQLFKDDFSLANLERQTRGAVGGRELTKPELDNIQKVHDEFNKKVKDYEQTIKDLKDKNDQLEQAKAIEKLKKEVDFEKRKAAREGKIVTEKEKRAQTIEDIRAKLKDIRKSGMLSSDIPYRKELAAITPELGKLAKSYISEGITRLEDIVDKIHHDLSEDFPDLDKRDVRDALSGYGNERKVSKDELQKQLEQLKHQAKLISRLEDLQNGIKKITNEQAKSEKNAEIEELQKQIHELTKGETVNKAYITRMTNMAKEVKAKLESGDFEKHVKLPVELTPEAREARAGYLRVKRDFDRALERKRLAERHPLFKLADWGVKWRRFVLFMNLTTWVKLGSYATLETLSKPLHEIVGSGIRQLPYLSKVAALAPREGHAFNAHVEAKAFAQLWAKGTWGDILKNIKNKEGDLKASHSDNLDSTPDQPWLDIGQNLHSAIKEIPLHAEVERSIYLRTMHAMKNNIDVSQPLVQLKIVAESLKDNLPGAKIKEIEDKAYQDGLRSIMMQDNIVSNAYSEITKYLDRIAETGKITKNIAASERFKGAAKGISTLLKIFIPITKVPVNYVLGRLEYTPVLGAAKAILVMRRGLEKMSPDDADYVMRIMKKQGIGAGMLAIGYLNPTNFGGFSVTANKRRSGQLKANEIKLFGVTLLHFMTHTPFLTIMTLGATLRHIHDNYVEGSMTDAHIKQARKEHWYSDVPLAMTRDINKQIPFTETPNELTDAMRNKESWNKFGADFIEGLVLPPDVKQLAKAQDTHKTGDKKGELIQRKTDGFGDALKSDIPGLRKTLPRKPEPAE